MFDWEDQEIANIIWGEADKNVVTYPEESENISQSFHRDHDKSEANEKAAESKKSGLDKDPEISENQDDDGGLGNIIGNNWPNTESFDYLNYIFSNDELVGHASLDSTDEFWAPSLDVLDNAVDSSSLGLDSINWGVEVLDNSPGEFNFNLHTENKPYGNIYEKETDSPCYTQKMLHSRFDEEEIDAATDQNLTSEEVDSCSISEVDDQYMEDTVLYQLQDTVIKLDMNIRLCIRESLFRLARSAMQRHSANDPSTANRIGEINIAQEDISNQEILMRTPNPETETNQIDRAIAQLLFHWTIKSRPIAPKMITSDPKNGSSSNLPPHLMTKGSHNVQNISTHVLKKDLSEQSNEDILKNQKMKQKMVETAD